jgi:hypothetical protein
MQVVFDYLEGLVGRYSPIKFFAVGYPDEQGGGGATPYPQIFLEAELSFNETSPGHYECRAALQVLDRPAAHGLNAGTRWQRDLLAQTGEYVEELLEQLRVEDVLQDVKLGDALTLTDVGRDKACGHRIEVSFSFTSAVDRAQAASRFTPLP